MNHCECRMQSREQSRDQGANATASSNFRTLDCSETVQRLWWKGPYGFLRHNLHLLFWNSLTLWTQGILLLGIQGLEAAESTFLRIEAGIHTPQS